MKDIILYAGIVMGAGLILTEFKNKIAIIVVAVVAYLLILLLA